MKRIIVLFIALFLVATNAQAGRMYWRTALTGNGPGALDAISKVAASPGVPLATGDGAVVLSSQVYYYVFDAVSSAAESSPSVIAPDDAGAAGRWIRVPSFLQAGDVVGLATVAMSGSYNDLADKPFIPTDTDVQWSGTSAGLTPATGRASLGLGSAAVADTGTGAANVVLGSDARLSDARTPTAHNQAWSTITSTPTTLAGYGLTLAAPGPIGATTPSTAYFTTATAQQLELGPQPVGTTGELSLPEDPANPGGNTVGWKAPASISATVKWIMPSADGAAGHFLRTNGSATTSWSGLTSPGPIGTTTPDDVSALDVVADSVTTNLGPAGTTDAITLREDAASAGGNKFVFRADTSMAADTTVRVPSQMPYYITACPTTATTACTAGQQCYSSTYLYLCTATNTWRRTALATW